MQQVCNSSQKTLKRMGDRVLARYQVFDGDSEGQVERLPAYGWRVDNLVFRFSLPLLRAPFAPVNGLS
jgi:hypothetical protein